MGDRCPIVLEESEHVETGQEVCGRPSGSGEMMMSRCFGGWERTVVSHFDRDLIFRIRMEEPEGEFPTPCGEKRDVALVDYWGGETVPCVGSVRLHVVQTVSGSVDCSGWRVAGLGPRGRRRA